MTKKFGKVWAEFSLEERQQILSKIKVYASCREYTMAHLGMMDLKSIYMKLSSTDFHLTGKLMKYMDEPFLGRRFSL